MIKYSRVVAVIVFIVSSLLVVAPPTPSQADTPPQLEAPLTIWLPDTLYPIEARQNITGHFDNYRQSFNTDLDVRPKNYAEGELINNLALTKNVAPDAMPDLMLMRRDDVLRAVQLELIQPMDDWLPIQLLDGMSEDQINFGSVDGRLYGYPFLVDVQHMLYDADLFDTPIVTLNDVLESDATIIFPADSDANGAISQWLLLQYIAAGGTFEDEAGNPMLDPEIMTVLMEFYADGLTNGTINSCSEDNTLCPLNYKRPRDYWTLINDDTNMLAFMNASFYIQRRDSRFANMSVSQIVTVNGTPISMLNGWMWVVITSDEVRQNRARRFMEWVTLSDRMASFAEMLNLLPSTENALRLMRDDPNVDELTDLVRNAIFVPEISQRGEAALELQSAFSAVLLGADPQETVDIAMTNLASE